MQDENGRQTKTQKAALEKEMQNEMQVRIGEEEMPAGVYDKLPKKSSGEEDIDLAGKKRNKREFSEEEEEDMDFEAIQHQNGMTNM